MEVDRVPADRGPQPGAARPAVLAKLLHPPAGLVGVAHRRPVLVREDRPGERLEQRHEALQAVGQRSRRDCQPLVRQPRRDPAQRTQARTEFEQEARPDAGPVGRSGEQPRHRRRRHLQGRGCAVATPAPAGTDHPARVGLDLDLDDARATLAVGDIGLAATGTDACILRRIAPFLLLPEPGPPGAAVAGRAALLTALAPRARRLLPLALAPEQRLRQDGPCRTELGKLGIQRLDARGQRRALGLQLPRLGTQSGVAFAQRFNGVPRPHGRRPKLSDPLVQRREHGPRLPRRAATSANPPENGHPPPHGAAPPRALAPRPPAPVPAPRGHAPLRTGTASRAARTPAPPWAATRTRRPPRPAAPALPQNPRRASTCACRYPMAEGVTRGLCTVSKMTSACSITQGRGRYDPHMRRAEPRKDIWLRPLRRDWKRTLNR